MEDKMKELRSVSLVVYIPAFYSVRSGKYVRPMGMIVEFRRYENMSRHTEYEIQTKTQLKRLLGILKDIKDVDVTTCKDCVVMEYRP